MNKKFITFALTGMMFASSTVSAFACTGTIVGDEQSEDGNAMIARTEDISSAHAKQYLVSPRKTFKKGDMFKDKATGFEYPQPKTAYKYTYVPDTDVEDDGIYGAVGTNEKGVSISATISADNKEAVQAVDPFIEDGLREANIPSIVLPRAKTAKDGIKLIADIVEKKGSAEGSIIMMADHKETWYIEILSGHRYAAVKAPSDKVAVIPNAFMLGYVDVNDKNNIVSKDLESFAKENGFYQELSGKFHVALSYAEPLGDYDRVRVWGGQHKLAPSLNVPYDSVAFELFFTPDKKVSLQDVMELQRYRYEDTQYSADLPENKDVRTIGTERQAECHIIQIKKELPKEIGNVMWMAMGNAEHSVYLPSYSNITDTYKDYKSKAIDYDTNNAYWAFRAPSMLAELNREKYGASIREYWKTYEEKLIKKQTKTDKTFAKKYKSDKEEAAKFATKTAKDIAKDAITKSNKIFKQLFTYVSADQGRAKEEPFKPNVK